MYDVVLNLGKNEAPVGKGVAVAIGSNNLPAINSSTAEVVAEVSFASPFLQVVILGLALSKWALSEVYQSSVMGDHQFALSLGRVFLTNSNLL